jgi:pSer/pThr/pTyr-binding forkhead associated (FHA) protein
MPESPLSPHLATPAELQERLEVERTGVPFLAFRDGELRQRLVPLDGDRRREVTIGRDPDAHVCIDWDPRVSGLHAELRHAGSHWLIVDDGLSRNGTFLNGTRVVGRSRLRDRDEVRMGRTVLVFRQPIRRPRRSTAATTRGGEPPELSPAQQRVLIALCRPYDTGDAFARPATNQQIADDLYLSIPAVKRHLRILFQRFGLDELPQNEKRARLARVAFESGAVSSADVGRR